MKQARLYVGYIFAFLMGLAAHWEGLNADPPKTLGGCFAPFAVALDKC